MTSQCIPILAGEADAFCAYGFGGWQSRLLSVDQRIERPN